jgi:hypothetical protein
MATRGDLLFEGWFGQRFSSFLPPYCSGTVHPMGWGTFFEGLSALATVGALIAAIGAGKQAKRLFQIESSRDEQAQRADRRRQAARISAWAAMRIEVGGKPIYGVVVRNSSDDPVYDVRVACHGFTTERAPQLRCVPPGEYFVANVDIRKPDGKFFRWDYAKPVAEIRDPVRPFTASDNRGIDELSFRDNAGAPWRRAARGELVLEE